MREIPSSAGTALVVADGHRDAGLGHLSRSTAIAVALRCHGIESCCFAYGSEEPFERDGVVWSAFDPLDLPPRDVVVVDSYRLGAKEIRSLAARAPLVLLHDFGEPVDGAALVVSASPDGIQPSGHRLAGLRYAALRPMFWGLPERVLIDEVEVVLVSTGAGDLSTVGRDVAARIAEALPAARVALVRGPHGAVEAPEGVELVDSPTSLLGPLLEASLVVSAGGQTMLEAAAVGTPCIALPLVENQVRQVTHLAEIGAARLVPPGDLSTAVTAATELAADAAARAALSECSQRAVDGYGALRVAFEIARLIGAGR